MERCRIYTRQGAIYVTEESAEIVAARVFDSGMPTLAVETVVGHEVFPPERLIVRTEQIVAVQSMSDENWAFQKQTEEDHYRRLLSVSPQEQMAEAMQRLVDDGHEH